MPSRIPSKTASTYIYDPDLCYSQRIGYSARVFRIVFRLFGGVLLLVQIVKAFGAIFGGDGLRPSIIVGAAVAAVLLCLSLPSLLERAIATFANQIRRKRFSFYIYSVPFLLTALVCWAKLAVGPTSDRWMQLSSEGGMSEYGTAIAYLLVPVFSVPMTRLFWRQRRKPMALLYGLLTVGAFFVGMEEISWGQRLIGFEEPEFWTKNNVQSEFSFHNLAFFQENFLSLSFLVAGFLGSFCWIALRYWQKQRLSPRSPLWSQLIDLSYILPDWPVSSFFYPVFIFYILVDYAPYRDRITFLHSVDQEHWEFIMSLGILLFVVINFFHQGKEKDLAEAR